MERWLAKHPIEHSLSSCFSPNAISISIPSLEHLWIITYRITWLIGISQHPYAVPTFCTLWGSHPEISRYSDIKIYGFYNLLYYPKASLATEKTSEFLHRNFSILKLNANGCDCFDLFYPVCPMKRRVSLQSFPVFFTQFFFLQPDVRNYEISPPIPPFAILRYSV